MKKINEILIGDTFWDNINNQKVIVTNLTYSSAEVYRKKLTSKGINCTQWCHINAFNKRFK